MMKNNTTLETLASKENLDFVGIKFVIEALVLSEKMRDSRLSTLTQDQVEKMVEKLYPTIEYARSCGEGYAEMCDISNSIIEDYLTSIDTLLVSKADL